MAFLEPNYSKFLWLNFQGYGKSLWLMHGMFRANGGCGYVKKPDFLMHNQIFDPKIKLPVKKTLKVKYCSSLFSFFKSFMRFGLIDLVLYFQVKVYMGDGWHLDFKQTHFDLYSPPDFYTRVSLLVIVLLIQ